MLFNNWIGIITKRDYKCVLEYEPNSQCEVEWEESAMNVFTPKWRQNTSCVIGNRIKGVGDVIKLSLKELCCVRWIESPDNKGAAWPVSRNFVYANSVATVISYQVKHKIICALLS